MSRELEFRTGLSSCGIVPGGNTAGILTPATARAAVEATEPKETA